jgi:hypothetical protein
VKRPLLLLLVLGSGAVLLAFGRRCAGRAPATVEARRASPGQVDAPEVRGVEPALGTHEGIAVLAGRVLASNGAPAPRAHLWVETLEAGAHVGIAARADGEGRFRVDALESPPWRVTAWGAEVGELAARTLLEAPPAELVLELAAPGVLLLVLAAEPAPSDVRVVLHDAEGFVLAPSPFESFGATRPAWSSQAGEQGIELGGLARGEYAVLLQDLELGRAGIARASARAGERVRVDIALRPAGRLRVATRAAFVLRCADGLALRPAGGTAALVEAGEHAWLLPEARYVLEGAGASRVDVELASGIETRVELP